MLAVRVFFLSLFLFHSLIPLRSGSVCVKETPAKKNPRKRRIRRVYNAKPHCLFFKCVKRCSASCKTQTGDRVSRLYNCAISHTRRFVRSPARASRRRGRVAAPRRARTQIELISGQRCCGGWVGVGI